MKAMKSNAQSMKAVVSVTMDRRIKEQVQAKAEHLGITVSALVNLWVREFLQTSHRPSSAELRPNAKTEAELAEIEEDIKHGRNLGPVLRTKKELHAYFENLRRKAERRQGARQTDVRSIPSKV